MTETNETPLHVLQLEVDNVKRIKAIVIEPVGRTVVLSGRNAQGKTSVIDAIWLAIGGGAATRGTDTTDPIRRGEDEARVMVDFGELRVTRTWQRDDSGKVTTKLVVESATGKLASPQAILDSLVKQVGFDPLEFTQLDDKKQMAALSAVVALPFDPETFDAETKAIYDARTEVNRRMKDRGAQLAAMPRYPNAPSEKIDVAETLAELDAVQEHDRQRGVLLGRMERTRTEMAAITARIKELTAERDGLQERLTADDQDLDANTAAAPAVSAADLQQRLGSAAEVNSQVDANARYQHAKAELDEVSKDSATKTAQIAARAAQKRDALASVVMPVAGLGFDDGVVTYRGVPFKQASGAEQVEVSTAIAMAGNPRIRVVTIRDASLLDSEHRAIIERMAKERDYQVWLEVVDESGTAGVVIEDGMVQA